MRILKRDFFFLCLWVSCTVLYLALPEGTGGGILAGPLNLLSIGAILYGIIHFQPVNRLPWLLLCIGQLLRLVGDLLYYIFYVIQKVATYPYYSDLGFLLGILATTAALAMLGRNHGKSSNRNDLIDGLITAIGAGVMMAAFVITPLEETNTQTVLQNTVTVTYPILITLQLLTAMKLLVPPERRTRTNILLAVSSITYSVGITLHLASVVIDPLTLFTPSGPWILFSGLFIIVSYLSISSAAAHPQMAQPRPMLQNEPRILSKGGILILGTAALLIPLTLVVSILRNYAINPWLIAAGSGAITLLIMGKLAFLMIDMLANQKELALASTVFENANEGIFIVDGDRRIVSVNNAFTVITGYEEKDVVGKTMDGMQSDRYTPKDFQDITANIYSSENWRGEMHIKRKNGEDFPILLTASFLRDSQGHLTNGILLFTDITDWKVSEERLRHQANHDSLTGLPNRAYFRDLLVQALERSVRHGSLGAVMFLDIDYFKTINDRMGHDQGDILLQTIAQRLRLGLRGSDIVARLGGDEFVVLVEELKAPQDAARAAERLQEFFQQPVKLANGGISVTCSIGISLFPSDGKNVQEILKKADIALYRAKDSGRSTYRFFRQPAAHQ